MAQRLIWALMIIISLYSGINAAYIDPSLERAIADKQPGENVKALVYLSEQADIVALDKELKEDHATLSERNRMVIEALQSAAAQTQPSIATYLDHLQAVGLIKSYKLFWIANMLTVEASAGGIAGIASRQDVDKIYFDYKIEEIAPVKIDLSDNNLIASHENGLGVIDATAAWAAGFTGQGRVVMNIDTGVLGTHPALSDRFRGDVDQDGDVDESWFDPYDTHNPYPTDSEGHGTHTMGTICGRTADGDTIGVAIDARWIAAGAIDRGGGISRTVSDAIASFQWAVDPDGNPETQDNPDAIGNSWGVMTSHGYPPCDETFWSVIDNCEAAGSVVIFSAGNEGPSLSTIRRPADRGTTAVNCFSVGAVNGGQEDLPIASFSSRGPSYCGPNGEEVIKPEVVAPGVNIRSAYLNNSYANLSGTSMASPHVTGAVALIRQANPNLDAQTIKEILMSTARGLPEGDPDGEDNYYGYGIIDVYEACLVAQSLSGIDGFVRDIDNNPIQGARVGIAGTSKIKNSAADGSFSFALRGDTTYSISISKFGFTRLDTSIYVAFNETTHVVLTMTIAPVGTLQGYITDEISSFPITGAEVSIDNTPLNPAITNADGYYTIFNIPGGTSYSVSARASGHAIGRDSVFITVNDTTVLNMSLYPLESFELNDGGWIGSGDWQWGVPLSSPDFAYDGDKAWGTVLNGNYSSNANDSLMTGYYIINQPNASLSFYQWYDIETGWDGANVSASHDGGYSWIIIVPEGGYSADSIRGLGFKPGYTGVSDGWELATFDLGQFQNQALKFNFRLGSDGSLQRPGWTIDGVYIQGATLYNTGTPNIAVSPSSFSVSVTQGDSLSLPITISNTGDGLLAYGLRTLTFGNRITSEQSGMSNPNIAIAPDEVITNDDNVRTTITYNGPKQNESEHSSQDPPTIQDYGGPDDFGYMWFDSNEPDGPRFDWVDISSFGEALNFSGDDQNRGPYNLGFDFPFYNNTFNIIRVCTNGWISFTSTVTYYNNTLLPSTNEPNNLVAGFWDDINPVLGGQVYYYTNNIDSAIVAWVETPRYARTGLFTFEIILTANGDITYQYLTMTGTLNSATIGIENGLGTIGSMVSFNDAYVTDSLAVQYRIPLNWLSVNPDFGHNLPHADNRASAVFNAAELNAGQYFGEIRIRSNDLDEATVVLPCTLQVRPAGIEEHQNDLPTEYRLSQNYPNPFNPNTRILFALPRKSNIRIVVYDLLGREIQELANATMDAGEHAVEWNGRDNSGRQVSSGIYFYTLKTDGYLETKRMSLIK